MAAILRLEEAPAVVGKEKVAMVMNRVEGLARLRKQVETAGRDLWAKMVKAVATAAGPPGWGRKRGVGLFNLTP